MNFVLTSGQIFDILFNLAMLGVIFWQYGIIKNLSKKLTSRHNRMMTGIDREKMLVDILLEGLKADDTEAFIRARIGDVDKAYQEMVKEMIT